MCVLQWVVSCKRARPPGHGRGQNCPGGGEPSRPHQTLGTFNAKALHFTNNCATTRIWWMLWITIQQNVIYISYWLGLNTCPYCTHAAEASVGRVAQEREPAGRVPRLVRAAAQAPRETRRQPHRRERNLEYGRLQPGAQGTATTVSDQSCLLSTCLCRCAPVLSL